MRSAFVEELVRIAGEDDRVVLLTGDLGFTVVDAFTEAHPGRFFNVGVAEQNMVGVATGLAEAGFVPFCYSIATFATLRPLEFIRNGPLLHGLPVRIVGVGAGLDYGVNGVTHYALEDVAIMRSQPAMTVLTPADPDQARSALRATWELDGPIYFRLGRAGDPVPGLDGRFELGGLEQVHRGDDVVIFALGTSASAALGAAEILDRRGVGASVELVSTVQPLSAEGVVAAIGPRKTAVTVESHYRVGGLGSLIAEIVAEAGIDCRLLRVGVDRMPVGTSGSDIYLTGLLGIDAEGIAGAVLDQLPAPKATPPPGG